MISHVPFNLATTSIPLYLKRDISSVFTQKVVWENMVNRKANNLIVNNFYMDLCIA